MAINLNPFSQENNPEREPSSHQRLRDLWGRGSDDLDDNYNLPDEGNEEEPEYDEWGNEILEDDYGDEEGRDYNEQPEEYSQGPAAQEKLDQAKDTLKDVEAAGEAVASGGGNVVADARLTKSLLKNSPLGLYLKIGCATIALVLVLAIVFSLSFMGYGNLGRQDAPAGACVSLVDGHTFPIPPKYNYNYSDGWGDPRSGGRRHKGTDIMADKLVPAVAVVDGVITEAVGGNGGGLGGRNLKLKGVDGWIYYYAHLNNDNKGTDDGNAPDNLTFAPGIRAGVRVKAGQHIAFVGDSGNAEGTAPHIHFSMYKGDYNSGTNPYPYLRSWDPKTKPGYKPSVSPSDCSALDINKITISHFYQIIRKEIY